MHPSPNTALAASSFPLQIAVPPLSFTATYHNRSGSLPRSDGGGSRRELDLHEVVEFLQSRDSSTVVYAASYLQHLAYGDDAMKMRIRCEWGRTYRYTRHMLLVVLAVFPFVECRNTERWPTTVHTYICIRTYTYTYVYVRIYMYTYMCMCTVLQGLLSSLVIGDW